MSDKSPTHTLNVICELTAICNKYGLDTDANMPDFILGRYMYDSVNSLKVANKANSEGG